MTTHLSHAAAEFRPRGDDGPTPAVPPSGAPIAATDPQQCQTQPQTQTQHQRGGGSSNRGGGRGGHHGGERGGKPPQGGGQAQRGGRGGSRPQSAASPQDPTVAAQSQRGGRAPRGGGRGAHSQGGRGGGRGGGHSQAHHADHSHGDFVSAADAAAIEAALMDDGEHAAVAAAVVRSTSNPSSSSSSTHQMSAAELSRSMLGISFAPTTLQTSRFVSRPRTFPKGRGAKVFNKHVHVQAACHFVLGVHDASSFVLPDHLVDWANVELVVCPVDAAARDCPICLSPAVAAKITRCGHTYCHTCLLQYFTLSERNWARCPLCFDAVYPQAIKSTEFRVQQKYAEGDHVDFVLMRRFKDCVVPVPVSSAASSAASSSSSSGAPVVASHFARISLTTDIGPIVTRELRELFELRRSLREANDLPTLALVDQAEASVAKRIEEWQATHPHWRMNPTYAQMKDAEMRGYEQEADEKAQRTERARALKAQTELWPELPPPSSKPKPLKSLQAEVPASSSSSSSSDATAASSSSSSSLPVPSAAVAAAASATLPPSAPVPSGKSSSFFEPHEAQAEHRFNKRQSEKTPTPSPPVVAAVTETSSSPTLTATTAPSNTIAPPKMQRPGQHGHAPAQQQQQGQDSVYYFYQSTDGQQLYLHALNYRSLLLSYNNDVSLLPARIRGRIVHRDTYVIDQGVRAKFRFLSHLPLTASFGLALVELDKSAGLTQQALATIAPEIAADRKHRQQAAKRQRELNKRTIESSKALHASEGGSPDGDYPSHQWQLETSPNAFPDLNPLGLASAAPQLPGSATGSPELRASNWNVIADRGLASSELWAPLPAPAQPQTQASSAHWGAAAAPLSSRPAGPAPALGSSTGWGRKAPASQQQEVVAEEEAFPLPSVNRSGQTTLISTGSRRSYK